MTNLLKYLTICVCAMVLASPVMAQDQKPTPPPLPGTNEPLSKEGEIIDDNSVKKPVQWSIEKSLFMTPNEITSILQARRGLLAPKEAFDEDNQFDTRDSSPRILSLAGIVYVNRNDWTIWLNGERVTPRNIPDRVIDLTVKRDRIHMKWLDVREQRVIVITLRSHQRYDMDSGLMMPGT